MSSEAQRYAPPLGQAQGCRFCRSKRLRSVVDLGVHPLCQSQISPARFDQPEPFFPLHAFLCEDCFLVQLGEFASPGEIFSEYAYFSSFSDSWVKHAKDYVEMAVERFQLGANSQVVEIASNDGYLLQWVKAKGIPALGVEPATNVARKAQEKGIEVENAFFGRETAKRLAAAGKSADLLLGNNVLAHVPDLDDFIGGIALLLKPTGTLTMEFPHLMRLMQEGQFDTIYHEHFSYFSLFVVERLFAAHGLTLFDVQELGTHGGSLRIFVRHAKDGSRPVSPSVAELKSREAQAGLTGLGAYDAFGEQVREVKRKLLEFLISAKRAGKVVAGYGAAGKGNTLLNYCGIRTDFIDFTVDKNPYKQGHYLPGSRIPILSPDAIMKHKPDYLLILPWNLRTEIMEQMSGIRAWGGKFVVPIPEVRVFD